MTPVEIMALFVVVVSIIKMVVISVEPKIWMEKVGRTFYGNKIFMPISLILVIGGLFYLSQELSIIQIFAVLFVLMFLFAIGFMPYAQDVLPFFESAYKDKRTIFRKSWLSILVWLGLLAWVISEFFR